MSINQILHQITRAGTDNTQTKKVLDTGKSIPTDGTDGWAPGALFIYTSAAGGSSLYTNVGSGTSCDFDLHP